LRYLVANLEAAGLGGRVEMLEFDISQRGVDVVEGILARGPRVVGLGVYIWNVAQTTQVVRDLKRVRPDVVVVLGGPEVSYETQGQEIVGLADYVFTGEGDVAFAELCGRLLVGRRPLQKVVAAGVPEFEVGATKRRSDGATEGGDHGDSDPFVASGLRRLVALPYHLYTDADLAKRVVYVEASRGCPFKCEFCLSSLDVPVRNVPLEAFLGEMGRLFERGLRQFKFVDRTFNLNLNISRAILQFFLERVEPGLFLHFEMIPDRLPEALRGLIRQFPAGALQFEVGIQTFNPEVSALISRRQDYGKLEENLRFLREETGVHVHTDLIVGLPGEDVESFGRGFDRLVGMRPQEILVGMLKRLRGTPIVRHDVEWGMVYSANPPYEILQTKLIDFATMQRMRRFTRYWDLLGNSGNFRDTLPMLWAGGASAFGRFMELSDRLYERMGRNHGIALQDLAEFLFGHLTERVGCGEGEVAQRVWGDYQRVGRSDRPAFLRPFVGGRDAVRRERGAGGVPARQGRHLG
jgi:radical SAM superfamily enzyme YgiQ (UPF0313 family)